MTRHLAFAAVVAAALLSPGAAFALDCMMPRLDQTVIDGAVMIFEGIAGPERPLDSGEKAAVEKQNLGSTGDHRGDLRIYPFTVTRGWKGAAAGHGVDVLFNTYWGDQFREGEAYLVVSPQQVGDLFAVPLCPPTVELNYAADHGFLATLKRVLGDRN